MTRHLTDDGNGFPITPTLDAARERESAGRLLDGVTHDGFPNVGASHAG